MKTENTYIRTIIQDLRAAYFPTAAYRQLESNFRMLLEQRRADMEDGLAPKARGIVLVGQSGSGKTTAVEELVRQNRNLLATDPHEEKCEFIGLQVPSPATMKFVGAATLQALGYPITVDRPGPVIWDMAKNQLRERGTLFLHFDEAQDLARFQTDKERQSVVNTLKSLMENSQWPVGLILTGMPDLKDIVNQDAQLARRLYPVEIERLHAIRHVGPVLDLVRNYARRAKISIDVELAQEQFAQRLMHAADYEFGLLTEMVVQAITQALISDGGEAALCLSHFADVYHLKSLAVDGLNPFIAENFVRIKPRILFNYSRDEGHDL